MDWMVWNGISGEEAAEGGVAHLAQSHCVGDQPTPGAVGFLLVAQHPLDAEDLVVEQGSGHQRSAPQRLLVLDVPPFAGRPGSGANLVSLNPLHGFFGFGFGVAGAGDNRLGDGDLAALVRFDRHHNLLAAAHAHGVLAEAEPGGSCLHQLAVLLNLGLQVQAQAVVEGSVNGGGLVAAVIAEAPAAASADVAVRGATKQEVLAAQQAAALEARAGADRGAVVERHLAKEGVELEAAVAAAAAAAAVLPGPCGGVAVVVIGIGGPTQWCWCW